MGQNSDDMGQILAVKAHFETASPEERRRTCAMCMETFDSRNQLFEHLATCGGTCGTIQSRKAAQTTLSVLTISDHPHELHYSQSLRHHCCDLCDTDIKKPHDGYRCSDGCDFDVCMKCAKAYIKEDMKEAAKQSPPGRVLQALAWLLKQLIDDPSSVSREHINNALNHVEPSNPRPVQASLLSSSQLPYGSRVQVQSTCAFNGKLGRILSVAPYTVREWRTESLSKHHFRHDAMGRVVVEDGVARMCAGGFVRWRSLKPLFDAAMSTPDNEAKHHFRHDAMGRVVVEDGVARMCDGGFVLSKDKSKVVALALEDCLERRLVSGNRATALERKDLYTNETSLIEQVQLGEHENVERLLLAGAVPNAATKGTSLPPRSDPPRGSVLLLCACRQTRVRVC